MKRDQKIKFEEARRVKFIVDPSLSEETRVTIFPEKLESAKESIRKITNWHPDLEKFRPDFTESGSSD